MSGSVERNTMLFLSFFDLASDPFTIRLPFTLALDQFHLDSRCLSFGQ